MRPGPRKWTSPRRLVFFADTFALPAPGVVTVQEYGSSPRHRHRSVSTKTTSLLAEAGEARRAARAGRGARGREPRREADVARRRGDDLGRVAAVVERGALVRAVGGHETRRCSDEIRRRASVTERCIDETRRLASELHPRGSEARPRTGETRRCGSKTRRFTGETRRCGSETRRFTGETRRCGSEACTDGRLD
jgi:hypothetical protein